MQRPTLSPFYCAETEKESELLIASQPLLVILDLNETLLYRKGSGRNAGIVIRPGSAAFMEYIFQHHRVMIWASAERESVVAMCESIMTTEQIGRLVAIWGRRELRLSANIYHKRVQVYKQLSWIWEDDFIQQQHPPQIGQKWSQLNTVLVDNSFEKAISEPYNLIQVRGFHPPEADETCPMQSCEVDDFRAVVSYLECLKTQSNVSAYIRRNPFAGLR